MVRRHPQRAARGRHLPCAHVTATGGVGAGVGEAVFAVQAALTQRSGAIDYVVAAAVARSGRTRWEVGYAHGLIADASTRFFWRSPRRSAGPLSRDATLQTDGRSCLTVWLGRDRVFAGCGLHVDIPAPYQAYLEVQARDIGYHSRFQDFWAVRPGAVVVTGAPPRSRGVARRLRRRDDRGDPLLGHRAGEAARRATGRQRDGIAGRASRSRGPLRYSAGDRLAWSGVGELS